MAGHNVRPGRPEQVDVVVFTAVVRPPHMIAGAMTGAAAFAGAIMGQDVAPQALRIGPGRNPLAVVALTAGGPPYQVTAQTISFNVQDRVGAIVTIATDSAGRKRLHSHLIATAPFRA